MLLKRSLRYGLGTVLGLPVFGVLAGPLAVPAAAGPVLVQGSVLAAESGNVVEKAFLTVTLPDRSRTWSTPILEGHFALELPAGQGYEMDLRAPGFERYRSTGLNVVEGMGPLEFLLTRSLRLDGRVVDGKASPVAGATVSLFANGEPGPSVVTGPDGRFSLVPEAGEGVHELRVSHFRFQDADPVEVEIPAPEPLQIVLGAPRRDESASLSVVVLDPDGRTLSGVLMHLVARDDPFRSSGRSDRNGRYTFAALQPGSYELRCSHPAYSDSFGRTREVVVGSGDSLAVEIQFRGTESLRGVVTDERSEGLAGALLMLQAVAEPSARESDPVRTRGFYESAADEQGEFQFGGIEPGAYELVIRSADRQFQELRVLVRIPEDDDLVLEVERGRSLRFSVLDLDRRVLSRFGLRLQLASGEGGSFTQHFSGLGGPAVISGLAAADYVVTVLVDDQTSFAGMVDPARGPDVVLQLPASGEELIVRYPRP